MLKVLLAKDIRAMAQKLDIQVVERIKDRPIDRFESHKDVNIISFDWLDTANLKQPPGKVSIYYSKEDLFFVCQDEDTVKKVEAILKEEEETHEMIVYNFFSAVINDDMSCMEMLEDRVMATEEKLLTSSKKASADDIVQFRKELRALKRYYQQFAGITTGLMTNENGIISEENCRYFTILDNRVDRLLSNVMHLADYVTQIREAYQAQIDIEQNNLMKVFTVVATIFLPLTLLVGWYGMNFKMPEFRWSFGYYFAIILSVATVIGCIVFFKKKKWF